MEFYKENKILILRVAGIAMLLIGFLIQFWVTPKEVLSANDRATANIARMEAKVSGNGASSKSSKSHSSSKILDELKNTQAKQMQYLTIIAMIFGIGFLGYSFIKPTSKSDS